MFRTSHSEKKVRDRLQISFLIVSEQLTSPANSYLFKVNNRNTRTRCEICSKLTVKTPERRSSVSIVDFEQVNADWSRNRSELWINLLKFV